MKHLMLFAIGPVQDFIATARRSRDLWYGSWMLSELSRAAAKQVVESSGSLVFPVDPENILNVPNKIVAIVESDPEAFGDKVHKAVKKRINELGKEALDHVKTNTYKRTLAEEQINNLTEFYWVSVPFDENDYSGTRNQAEALLAARKVTRDFTQAVGDNVPKSSLDGARESVIPESEYPKKDDKDKPEKIRKLYDHYHARQGERLSGVDIMKRMGEPKNVPPFKSTSHMAALPFLEKMGKTKADEMISEIRELFDKAKWNIGEHDDGALLYESRLADWIPAGAEQNTLREKLNGILNNYAGKSRPSPYYALLAADGDNMGMVIDSQKAPQAHQALSRALSEFASEAKNIVEGQQGLLIYSGGDDVLAYLPLHTVLECARILEETFKGKLNQFEAPKDGLTVTPTLSIGIVIAHHLEPLSDVLELAREAEKAAKGVDKVRKNGFAVTLSKRSGVDRTISGKWGIFDIRLRQLVEFINSDAISTGTAYELQELHRVLSDTGIPRKGLVQEAQRIVGRKQKSGGEVPIDIEKVKKVFDQWLVGTTKDNIELNELAMEMIVAKMFADDSEPFEEKAKVKS
jgi:CRISPR-associated protein Cmr2